MNKYILSLLTLVLFIGLGCGESNSGGEGPTVEFDRRGMLAGWVDNVFVPAYTDLGNELAALANANDALDQDPTEENLSTLQDAFFSAYLSFQKASPFVVGKGEELRIRDQLNTYPTDINQIEMNVTDGDANLELPSQVIAQGFPAIEYILFGVDSDLVLSGETNNYRAYLSLLISRMQMLQSEVLNDWAGSRDAYVQNDGNSATASIDRTVNDFIFYYEKHLRAGKVGIPAGVFSDDPLADRVESLYQGSSKTLFLAALNNSIDFFENHGLKDYLDAYGVERDGEMLSTQILNQWQQALLAAEEVEEDFGNQVITDNVKLLQLYDELQRNVVLLKVDMLQALSINVDYVDADGD